jgi:hypothetical protein
MPVRPSLVGDKLTRAGRTPHPLGRATQKCIWGGQRHLTVHLFWFEFRRRRINLSRYLGGRTIRLDLLPTWESKIQFGSSDCMAKSIDDKASDLSPLNAGFLF